MDHSEAAKLLAEFESGDRKKLGKLAAMDALTSLIGILDSRPGSVRQTPRTGLTPKQQDASHWNK
jgi:hypothetical protein